MIKYKLRFTILYFVVYASFYVGIVALSSPPVYKTAWILNKNPSVVILIFDNNISSTVAVVVCYNKYSSNINKLQHSHLMITLIHNWSIARVAQKNVSCLVFIY